MYYKKIAYILFFFAIQKSRNVANHMKQDLIITKVHARTLFPTTQISLIIQGMLTESMSQFVSIIDMRHPPK